MATATSCVPVRRWRRTRPSDGLTGGRADGPAWSLIVDPVGRSGVHNMAVDEELLAESERCGAHFLRLYCWNPPTLSVGRNQPLVEIPDYVAVVRRPTGGQAVWHEHELTYAVAAPVTAFGSLRIAYRTIHERLAAALSVLGVEAVLAAAPARRPVSPSARPTSCFAAATGGEILVQGRKLVGSAQVRRGNAFLQHGSILLAGSQAIVRASGETTLSAVLGRPVSFEELSRAILTAWGAPFSPSRSGVTSLAVKC